MDCRREGGCQRKRAMLNGGQEATAGRQMVVVKEDGSLCVCSRPERGIKVAEACAAVMTGRDGTDSNSRACTSVMHEYVM